MAVVFPYVRNTTWADGQGGGTPIDAADLNKIEDGIFNVHQQPAVRVFHNASQAITTGTETTLAFNSERYDQAGGSASTMHDTATNNSRLTAIYAGVYSIGASIDWATVAAGTFREVCLRINGSTKIARDVRPPTSAGASSQSVSAHYSFAVNDYVEVRVTHDMGSTQNVVVTSNASPEFWMVRVA
jgi:hypothetical protein